MLVLCFAGLVVFRDDARLDPVRALATDTSARVYQIAAAPRDGWRALLNYFQSRRTLQAENARLRQENLVVKGQTQRLAAVLAENARYRALLNSAQIVEDQVMVAEVISVTADPARHLLILDKGDRDGVVKGQPLLGADGLMGQIVQVGRGSSRAMLVTDSTHAVPIQVNRSGVRGLAEGVGAIGRLVVRHIAATTDIKVGDTLVTSGLGGRFPPGYPVAVVEAIEITAGDAFAQVTARPLAKLDRGRHVLIALPEISGPDTGL